MDILLIEPDMAVANIYGEALRLAGHRVTHSVDAQLAIHLADGQTPDLVILELQLARHNGVEFLYEFRSYPEWAAIPVIVISTVPDDSLSPGLQANLGIAAYHYKPQTTLRNLLRSIDRVSVAGSDNHS